MGDLFDVFLLSTTTEKVIYDQMLKTVNFDKNSTEKEQVRCT